VVGDERDRAVSGLRSVATLVLVAARCQSRMSAMDRAGLDGLAAVRGFDHRAVERSL